MVTRGRNVLDNLELPYRFSYSCSQTEVDIATQNDSLSRASQCCSGWYPSSSPRSFPHCPIDVRPPSVSFRISIWRTCESVTEGATTLQGFTTSSSSKKIYDSCARLWLRDHEGQRRGCHNLKVPQNHMILYLIPKTRQLNMRIIHPTLVLTVYWFPHNKSVQYPKRKNVCTTG